LETAEQQATRYETDAARLRREAEMVRDPTLRQQLIDIASQYESLARTVRWLKFS
jgi:hypothetical protein